jgi:BirA family biotin operon repressor/biotin-[acetyl-CoA-carboxylase] ligase
MSRDFDSLGSDMATPYDIVHLTEVGSTQDEAAQRFATTGSPVLVVADRQVEGRGRQGRSWQQPDRAMFSSLAVDTNWKPEHRTLVPLITGVVVSEEIALMARVVASLKWPNDILVPDGKAGGILVEVSGNRMTVGCGINLWWADPIEGAAAIFSDDPGPNAATELAMAWATALLAELQAESGVWRASDYEALSVTLGREVAWEGGTGTAASITESGALVVTTSEGNIAVHAGDVHMRGWR